MSRNRARMDRRFSAAPTATLELAVGSMVVFRDGWGEVTKRYDLAPLALPSDMKMLFADAFQHHHAASSHGTQRHCWAAIRVFTRFVVEDDEIQSVVHLTSAMIGRYISWLDHQKSTRSGKQWTEGTRAGMLTHLRLLIDWTKRHHPNRLPTRIDFPYSPYSSQTGTARPRLNSDELKAILRACYEEIDETWTCFETGRVILDSAENVEGIDPDLCELIRNIAKIGGGMVLSQKELIAQGVRLSAMNRHGGLRAIRGYLHLTGPAAVPFFIALAIQTASNPDALRLISRDCQVPHPLDEHRIIIEWAKPRAGAKVKRAQRRSFDRRRHYAASNLIDKLLAMTAPLVLKASQQDRNRLFLIKSEKKETVTLLAEATLSHTVKHFIIRANARIAIWNRAAPDRQRALLPDFASVFFRGSVATEHYKAGGGDVLAAQAVLNHARTDTTELYLKGPETSRIQRETIARLQQLMISWIVEEKPIADDQSVHEGVAQGTDATAHFSHTCLNPLAGTGPGSTIGRVCRHFGGCLRCPGLVIPLDADHMARVLRAKNTLERARRRLDPRRWELLYASSYRILVEDILPDFPEALRPAAEQRIAALPLLPELE